jgi:hypothetical protein
MINKKFGKWEVIKEIYIKKQHCKHYQCKCECGTITIIPGTTLRLSKSKQCRKCSFYKHGMSKTNIYRIWGGIISRCYNSKVKIYKYYGGRGIKVCPRWLKFENFYSDMGNRPDNLQLDRIDNNGNYEPSNCRWVTAKENNPSNKGTLKDDMPGKIFGNWKVIQRISYKPQHRYYECVCVCGTNRIITGGDLRRGRTTQCRKCKDISHRGWKERRKMNAKELRY